MTSNNKYQVTKKKQKRKLQKWVNNKFKRANKMCVTKDNDQ